VLVKESGFVWSFKRVNRWFQLLDDSTRPYSSSPCPEIMTED
jgi:hypothetical protein